MLQKVHTR